MNVRSEYRKSFKVLVIPLVVVLVFGLVSSFAVLANSSSHIRDINPDVSDNSNPNASTGGRVNGLATDADNNQIFYAASEWGGLFKTTDGGATWFRLDAHLPVVTWDVEVDPNDSSKVYATSFYDGRVNPVSGIEVSHDGGMTWTHPATAQPNDPVEEGTPSDNTPQAGYSCSEARRTEPSAFGIGIRPDDTDHVYIGTNCGVAISDDGGITWTFVDPTPSDSATNVWDVVVQAGGANGIVDICGDDGHYRSTDGGITWTGGSGTLPGGRCSIAVSPDESYVIFVVAADNHVYESDDAGTNWTNLGYRDAQGRIPFVVTNQRSDVDDTDRFNLWYSDTQLYRADCTTPDSPAPGGSCRCPLSGSWTKYNTGAHWDAGDLVFDTAASCDACPMVYSSDGGVHTNTISGDGCHEPVWTRSNVGLHAMWVYTMDGAHQAGDANEDLYFGCQDTGTFATTNAGTDPPTWTNPNCCDTFDMLASPNWVLGTTCCFGSGRFNRLELANPGYSSPAEINTYPTGNIPTWDWGHALGQFGTNSVALITSAGLFITTDITANPITWTGLGAPAGPSLCDVQVAMDGATPTFYVKAGQCSGRDGDSVFAYTGTAPGGTWTQIDNTDGLTGGFGIFACDPNDPDRLYASNLAPGGPQMVFSTDGGTTWDNDPELDNMMTGGGVFKYQNQRGPTDFTKFYGYPQSSLVAFDPDNPNILVAGGIDSGVFFSATGGQNWTLLTDPFTGDPHIPRPRYAYFDHEPAGTVNIYIGSEGRGVWRISLQSLEVKKDYRYTNVCFERDNDGDGLFNEDPVNFEDPEETIPIDDDDDGLFNEDDVDCLEGTYLGDPLPVDADGNYILEAVVKKNGKVSSYNPGQYYAVSTVDVLLDVDTLTIEEYFTDCSDIGTVNPVKGGGKVVIVQVGPDDPEEVAYQILDANSEEVTVDDGTVTVVLEGVAAGTTILMYVKFEPALKGEQWPGPLECENYNIAWYGENGPDEPLWGASAKLKLVEKD